MAGFSINKHRNYSSGINCKLSNLFLTIRVRSSKLKLNNDKSEFLFLHSRFRHSLPPPTISVGMENIRPSQQTRNLGVIFDDTMSLSPHVNTIVKGAFYYIRNISKIRKYISKRTTDFCGFLLRRELFLK